MIFIKISEKDHKWQKKITKEFATNRLSRKNNETTFNVCEVSQKLTVS